MIEIEDFVDAGLFNNKEEVIRHVLKF